MEPIIQILDIRKAALKQSALCEFLRNEEYSVSMKLSFAPAMLFFAMGFKDILDTLKDENTDDPLQKVVNVHCEEDSTHWEWYLNDLLRIPFGKNFLEKHQKAIFTEIWSEKYKPVRQLVYDCICLSQRYTSPFYKLILIEALEATFECFNEPVFDFVQKMGLGEELEYFGQAHAHSEENHSMGKSGDGTESSAYHAYTAADFEIIGGINIVNAVFDSFDKVFECWLQDAQSKSAVAST